MAYTAPTTRTTGELITAAIWNGDLTDNIAYLHDGLYTKHIVLPLAGLVASVASAWTSGAAYTTQTSDVPLGGAIMSLIPNAVKANAEVYYEAVLHAASGGTAYSSLYVNAVQVAGSEVSSNATLPTRLRSANIAANLSGAAAVNFQSYGRSSSGSYNAYLTRAAVIIVPVSA